MTKTAAEYARIVREAHKAERTLRDRIRKHALEQDWYHPTRYQSLIIDVRSNGISVEVVNNGETTGIRGFGGIHFITNKQLEEL